MATALRGASCPHCRRSPYRIPWPIQPRRPGYPRAEAMAYSANLHFPGLDLAAGPGRDRATDLVPLGKAPPPVDRVRFLRLRRGDDREWHRAPGLFHIQGPMDVWRVHVASAAGGGPKSP